MTRESNGTATRARPRPALAFCTRRRARGTNGTPVRAAATVTPRMLALLLLARLVNDPVLFAVGGMSRLGEVLVGRLQHLRTGHDAAAGVGALRIYGFARDDR